CLSVIRENQEPAIWLGRYARGRNRRFELPAITPGTGPDNPSVRADAVDLGVTTSLESGKGQVPRRAARGVQAEVDPCRAPRGVGQGEDAGNGIECDHLTRDG